MRIPAKRQINGTYGMVWWDGEQIFEVESFESKATPNREDVPMAMSVDVDSKITSVKCEGTLKVKKVFSRGIAKLVEAWKKGQDPRSQLIGKLADPDAYGTERVVLGNVWFNELVLMQFELGQKLEREFPFGHTLSDVDFPDLIQVQED